MAALLIVPATPVSTAVIVDCVQQNVLTNAGIEMQYTLSAAAVNDATAPGIAVPSLYSVIAAVPAADAVTINSASMS